MLKATAQEDDCSNVEFPDNNAHDKDTRSFSLQLSWTRDLRYNVTFYQQNTTISKYS